jgi:nucleotide-binding universal stress UspA family protein
MIAATIERPGNFDPAKERAMSHIDAASVIPTKILVPIDFSPSSHQALEGAIELAGKFGCEVYLLHVIPEFPEYALPEGVTPESLVEGARKAAETHFEVAIADLKSKNVKAACSIMVDSDVAGAVVETAEREGANLMVLTTHGTSGWYPQIFGAVTEKLLRLAPCPVLLLRTNKPESSAKVTYSGMMEWW